MKKIKVLFFIIIFLFGTNIAAADLPPKHKVNILVWYGYMDAPEITNTLEQKCGASVSHDVFYSNDEFLRRFKAEKNNYDIIIYSDTVYNLVKDDLVQKQPTDLSKIASKFMPPIKKHFFEAKFPKNTIYFMHSLTGFWWNPSIINITPNDSLEEIFSKANKNTVILLDDPVEIWNLINRANDKNFTWSSKSKDNISLNLDNFDALTKNATIFVANSDNKVYSNPKFAFAFLWSGDVMNYMKEINKSFKFIVHPKLSYVSTDLLTTLNNKAATACVAKTLMSKPILNIVQRDTYYFSPYGDISQIKDPIYQNMYSPALKQLSKLSWLVPVSATTYIELQQEWMKIQLDLQKKMRANEN